MISDMQVPWMVKTAGAEARELFDECLQQVVQAGDILSTITGRMVVEQIRKAETIDAITYDAAVDAVADALGGEESVPANDPTITEEIILAALLYWAHLRQYIDEGAQKELMDAAAINTSDAMESGIVKAEEIMAKTIEDQKIGPDIEEVLVTGFILGVAGAVSNDLVQKARVLTLIGNVPSLPFVDDLEDLVAHYANRYFHRIITPALRKRIAAEVTARRAEDMLGALENIQARYIGKSAGYWRMVANAHSSRVYSYGNLRAAQLTGRRGYRLVAVLDKRTTALCRSLNGREFWVADAIALMESSADGGPDAMVKMMPWMKPSIDTSHLTSGELSAAGVMIPPFHANCRTTLVPIV